MHVSTSIQFLTNIEIDKARWNKCIDASFNGLIYARTFYLDNIATDWSALTGENYEWVLPLTHRSKYGISYLYQPPFCQQLGVFALPHAIVPYKQIVEWLQQQYRFWEVNWNYATSDECIIENLKVQMGINYILNLNTNYQSIAQNYSRDLLKNLKRSKNFNLQYEETKDFVKCIDLHMQMYHNRMPRVKKRDFENFKRVCKYAEADQTLICRQAAHNNEVLATALLLTDGKRLYNLMNTTTEAGRKKGANHFLLDAVIYEFSGKQLVFDFEGSDLLGVKEFYENFKPVNQAYFIMKYNYLPKLLQLFKK